MALIAPSGDVEQHPSARNLINKTITDDSTQTETNNVSISIGIKNNDDKTVETVETEKADKPDKPEDDNNDSNTIMSLPNNDSLTQHPSARQLIKDKNKNESNSNNDNDNGNDSGDINISLKMDNTDGNDSSDDSDYDDENNMYNHPKTGQFGFTKRMSMPTDQSPANTPNKYHLRIGSVTDELLEGPLKVLNKDLDSINEYSDDNDDIRTENDSDSDHSISISNKTDDGIIFFFFVSFFFTFVHV